MAQSSLSIDVQASDKRTTILALTGVLDGAAATPLTEAYLEAARRGTRVTVIELSALGDLTPLGLGALLRLYVDADKGGRFVIFTGVPDRYRRLFDSAFSGEIPMMASATAPAGGSPAAKPSGWAEQFGPLRTSGMPPEAYSGTVEGRRTLGLLEGFGQTWHKTYSVRIAAPGVTPSGVSQGWRHHFGTLWPSSNRYYVARPPLQLGEVAILGLPIGPGVRVYTGVEMVYADDNCFALMPVQGHMFGGMIVFSATQDDDAVIAEVDVLVRAADPVWQVALMAVGYRIEDATWAHTLHTLAGLFGTDAKVTLRMECLDTRLHARYANNVRYNAAIGSLRYMGMDLRKAAGSLVHRLKGLVRGRQSA